MKFQRTILPELADDSRMRRLNWLAAKYGTVGWVGGWKTEYTYYQKPFLDNLKANMSLPNWESLEPLPESEGQPIKLYSYNVTIGEYADYTNFTDIAVKAVVDETVTQVAADMAIKMGMSLNALVEATEV